MLALVGGSEYLRPIVPVDRGFPGWKPGFALMRGATTNPHFDEIPQRMLRPMRRIAGKELTILGIKGNTALVQTTDGYEVLSSGGVTVRTRTGQTRYTAGPLPFRTNDQ